MHITERTVAQKLTEIVKRATSAQDMGASIQEWEPASVFGNMELSVSGRFLTLLQAHNSKPKMAYAMRYVIEALGWCKDTVWIGTYLWALWYGRDMYLEKYGHYPVDNDAWLTACFRSDDLELVLESEY